MRVALNAQLLSFRRSYRSGGISRVIYHQLQQFRERSDGAKIIGFVPGLPPPGELDPTQSFKLVPSRLPTERPAVRIGWEQTFQPIELARWDADIHHSLSFALPLAWRGPSVLTVFDLSFLRFPELFNRGNRLYKTVLTRLSARRADAVITISAHGKREVAALLGVPPSRITVAYPGVDARFKPLQAEAVRTFRESRGLPERFILFLGTLEPRKNAAALVEAYADLRRRTTLPHKLVLAGGEGWQASPLYSLVERLGLRDQVVLPGFVPSEEQVLWYNAADVLAYPSVYEGFGLPPLEAMACGVPVVTSNSSSLPEVVGDAGLLVDPRDRAGLSAALEQALCDQGLRERLAVSGPLRARRFTWQAMASEILAVYHSLSASRAR